MVISEITEVALSEKSGDVGHVGSGCSWGCCRFSRQGSHCGCAVSVI